MDLGRSRALKDSQDSENNDEKESKNIRLEENLSQRNAF